MTRDTMQVSRGGNSLVLNATKYLKGVLGLEHGDEVTVVEGIEDTPVLTLVPDEVAAEMSDEELAKFRTAVSYEFWKATDDAPTLMPDVDEFQ